MAAALLERHAGGPGPRALGRERAGRRDQPRRRRGDARARDRPRAGEPARLEPDAVRAADVVVTMGCGDACPVFPGKRYEDWELEDPAGKPLADVRRIRDEIDRARACARSKTWPRLAEAAREARLERPELPRLQRSGRRTPAAAIAAARPKTSAAPPGSRVSDLHPRADRRGAGKRHDPRERGCSRRRPSAPRGSAVRVAPAPSTEPEIVCVVETGKP